jgi:hypothetical protein
VHISSFSLNDEGLHGYLVNGTDCMVTMNTSQKYLPIAACALILVGGATYYWHSRRQPEPPKIIAVEPGESTASSTERETFADMPDIEIPGWKTYWNSDLGFKMQYPENWEVAVEFSPGATSTSPAHIPTLGGVRFQRKGQGPFMDPDALLFHVSVIDSDLNLQDLQKAYEDHSISFDVVSSTADLDSIIPLLEKEPTFSEGDTDPKHERMDSWHYGQHLLLKVNGHYFSILMFSTGFTKEDAMKHVSEYWDALRSLRVVTKDEVFPIDPRVECEWIKSDDEGSIGRPNFVWRLRAMQYPIAEKYAHLESKQISNYDTEQMSILARLFTASDCSLEQLRRLTSVNSYQDKIILPIFFKPKPTAKEFINYLKRSGWRCDNLSDDYCGSWGEETTVQSYLSLKAYAQDVESVIERWE